MEEDNDGESDAPSVKQSDIEITGPDKHVVEIILYFSAGSMKNKIIDSPR